VCLCGSENKQRSFHYTALIDWFLQRRRRSFTARYGLSVYTIHDSLLALNTSPFRRIWQGGVTASNQNLSTRVRWMASFTLRPLYYRYDCTGFWVDSTAVSNRLRRRNFLPRRELNPFSAGDTVTIQTELPLFPEINISQRIKFGSSRAQRCVVTNNFKMLKASLRLDATDV